MSLIVRVSFDNSKPGHPEIFGEGVPKPWRRSPPNLNEGVPQTLAKESPNLREGVSQTLGKESPKPWGKSPLNLGEGVPSTLAKVIQYFAKNIVKSGNQSPGVPTLLSVAYTSAVTPNSLTTRRLYHYTQTDHDFYTQSTLDLP